MRANTQPLLGGQNFGAGVSAPGTSAQQRCPPGGMGLLGSSLATLFHFSEDLIFPLFREEVTK